MSILAPRPYRLATGYFIRSLLNIVAMLAVAGAAIVGGLGWEGRAIRVFETDRQLWKTGTLTDDVSVKGTRGEGSDLINHYQLEVEYADKAGRRHHGVADFELFGWYASDETPVSVRYDPANPDRFVLNWAAEHDGARWVPIIAFLLLVPCFLGAIFAILGVTMARQLVRLRRIAERSDEIVAEIVLAWHSRNTLKVEVRYTRPNGTVRQFTQAFAGGETPLYTNPERTHAVALVSPHDPDFAWLMPASFHPFVVSAA